MFRNEDEILEPFSKIILLIPIPIIVLAKEVQVLTAMVKLYTRSTKRGDITKILDILIQHGADPEISVDTHPHIGSNKLPKIVAAIRQTILDNGGEIHFNSRVDDFIING